MAEPDGSLTLEQPAHILREHMEGTAARFGDVASQFAEVGARLDAVATQVNELRGEVQVVAAASGSVQRAPRV